MSTDETEWSPGQSHSRIRVCIASCVRRSSFASFLSISRFRSQFGRFGAMLNTSCVLSLIGYFETYCPRRVEERTSSCARRFSSSAIICAASPLTWFSTVSSITMSSFARFLIVRDSGSKLRLFMRGSATLDRETKAKRSANHYVKSLKPEQAEVPVVVDYFASLPLAKGNKTGFPCLRGFSERHRGFPECVLGQDEYRE